MLLVLFLFISIFIDLFTQIAMVRSKKFIKTSNNVNQNEEKVTDDVSLNNDKEKTVGNTSDDPKESANIF